MGKQKSILQKIEIDTALRAHDCQHNNRHRILKGHKRLKLSKDRSYEHFCVECAKEILTKDIQKLEKLLCSLRETSGATNYSAD